MSDLAPPRSMSENAKDAARLVAREQQKRKGRKVRVIALAEGFDGFKTRIEGERFIAWWPDGMRPPSWQQEVAEYEKEQKALARADAESELE